MAIKRYDIIELNVHGLASGQAIDNNFHYRIGDFVGEKDLGAWMVNFSEVWQAEICPLLTSEYTVINYEAKILHNMIWLDEETEEDPPGRPAIRYREIATLDGGVADVGTDAPPSHATHTAISISKECGFPENWAIDVDPESTPETQLGEKLVRGGFRLSCIAEDLSEAASQNEWTAAYVTAVGNAVAELLNVPTDAPAEDVFMVVLSEMKNKKHRVLPVSGFPTLFVSYVTSLAVNPFVGSQDTRRQKRAA